MFIFVSAGPWGTHQGENPSPGGCSFGNMTQWAPYVRVGQDTADTWGGMNTGIDGTTTRLIAPLIQPHHYGDLASLMVGKVHKSGGAPGPDYFIPSTQSHLSTDEVYSFASMGASIALAGRQTGRQAGRQAGWQTDSDMPTPAWMPWSPAAAAASCVLACS